MTTTRPGVPAVRVLATLTLAAALTAVGGCTGPDPAPGPGTPPGNSPAVVPDPGGSSGPAGGTPGGAATADPSPAPPAATTGPDLGAPQQVATGIRTPWGLAFLPGGDALVAERDTGRVLRVPAAGGTPREVYRVPGVTPGGEGGLLGLAVPAGTRPDPWVYAYHTADNDNRIVRFRLSGGTPEVIFDGISKATFHNGGRIAFGPDGMLYAGTGDAGDRGSSQDAADPNGKILRLTPDGDPAPGNPTGGSPVYSLGHRNVQGLAWDRQGRLFATEFGQNRLDEVNLIRPGANYGWPEVEGAGTGGGRFVEPLVTWATSEASPSGAAITGDTLYVAALRGQRLWTVPLRGEQVGTPRAEFSGRYGRLRTVAVAPDGALWLSTSNTDRGRGAREGDDRLLRFAAR